MDSMLNDVSVASSVDVICVQEPYSYYSHPVSHPHWRPYGRSGRFDPLPTIYSRTSRMPGRPRVLTYVHSRLRQADISVVGEFHPDILSIKMHLAPSDEESAPSELYVHNVYNPSRTHDTAAPLMEHFQKLDWQNGGHHLVCGDFNTHHTYWQPNVMTITDSASQWLVTFFSLNLELITPPGTITYTSKVGSTDWTLDLALATPELAQKVVSCTLKEGWSQGSDHEAVLTTLDLNAQVSTRQPRFNMKRCDGETLGRTACHLWEGIVDGLPPLEEDPGAWAEGILTATAMGLAQTTPLTRPGPHAKPWFSQALSWQRAATARLRHRWQRERTDEAWEAYVRMRNAYLSAIRRAKRNSAKEALAKPDGQLWRLANAGTRSAGALTVEALQGEHGLVTAVEEKERVLRAKFFPTGSAATDGGAAAAAQPAEDSTTGEEAIGGPEPETPVGTPAAGSEEEEEGRDGAWQWTPITAGEVQRRIAGAKRDTAAGIDGIPWSALKLLALHWPNFCALLALIFDACVRKGVHPAAFKRAKTIILRKPGKESYSVAGAYRPITLLSTLAKLLEAIVASRILHEAQVREGVLAKQHYGGRPFRSAEDATLQVQQFIRDAQAAKCTVAVLAVDVAGAYNGVKPDQLAADMARSGWPTPVRRWVRSFMSGRTTRLQIGDYVGQDFGSSLGLPQGSPVSQILWLCSSGGLVEAGEVGAEGSRRLSVGWVDDWTTVFAGRTAEELNTGIRAVTSAAEAWAQSHGAEFDAAKSSVMLLNRVGAERLEVAPIQLQGRTVQAVDHCCILGVTFEANGRFKRHVADVAARAMRKAAILLSWGSRTWGFSMANARQLYLAGVLPTILYAATTWMPSASERARGRAGYLRQFASLQRAAAISITGAYRATAGVSLDYEADLLPVEELFNVAHARALLRLLQVPVSHPLAPVVRRCLGRGRKRYVSPLQAIVLQQTTVVEAAVRRRPPNRPPTWDGPETAVPPSKEVAEQAHHWLKGDDVILHVYTDGSKEGGRVGAAAVWPVHGGWRTSRLALPQTATVMQAEITAIRLALDMLRDSLAPPQPTIIWSDSQAAIKAIASARTSDEDVRAIQDRLLRLASSWDMRIQWIPGHRGIEGNEKADAEARAAGHLPISHQPLTPSTSHVMGAVREQANGKWLASFLEGNGESLRAVLKEPRVGRSRRRHKGLTRAQTALLTQLRTGHNGLHRYLFNRTVLDSPSCRCGHPMESRRHFFLECPLFERQRTQLERSIGRGRARSLRDMLDSDDPQVTRAVLVFAGYRFPPYAEPGAL